MSIVFRYLPERFHFTIHNMIGHPLRELLWQLGFEDASDYVHDNTLPPHEPGTGRG